MAAVYHPYAESLVSIRKAPNLVAAGVAGADSNSPVQSAKARLPDTIIAFGDSLTCPGRYFHIKGEKPPRVFSTGRHSTGLLAAENLAYVMIPSLKGNTEPVPIKNYACAWAAAQKLPEQTSPSLLEQIDAWERDVLSMEELRNTKQQRMYFIWIGGNDYLSESRSAKKIVAVVRQAIERILAIDPFANFFLPTILPGDSLPKLMGRPAAKLAARLMQSHADELRSMADAVTAERHLDPSRILVADVTEPFRELVQRRQELGFDNELKATFDESYKLCEDCQHPDDRVMVDDFHPTAPGHWYLAEAMMQRLMEGYGLERRPEGLDFSLGWWRRHRDQADRFLDE